MTAAVTVPAVSVVVLTTGDRPEALRRCLRSVADQRLVDVELVVVTNTDGPVDDIRAALEESGVADSAVVVEPGANLGVPGGRNAGVEAATHDVVLLLDDDAWLLSPIGLVDAVETLEAHPGTAVLGLGIVTPDGERVGRHVPSARGALRLEAPPATTFPGGGSLLHRATFLGVGGFPSRFWWAHEEIDLTWRLVDAGHDVRFRPLPVIGHPRTPVDRRTYAWRSTARNRVWLARRRLPWLLAVPHALLWTVVAFGRAEGARLDVLRGAFDGLRGDPGERAPMSWRTVVALGRRGRFPLW